MGVAEGGGLFMEGGGTLRGLGMDVGGDGADGL